MTLVFWMQVAPQTEPPNAELFAYGGTEADNYFRTGFGCISTGITPGSEDSKCYFVVVFKTENRVEYFHTYNDANFEFLNQAFVSSKWAHVMMMLTTKNPGFVGDVAEGEGCPNNWNDGEACNGAVFLWVNKDKIGLVDWNDGQDTTYAEEWNSFIGSDIWESKKITGTNGAAERRFFVSSAANCEDAAKCGLVTLNNMKWNFPWHGAYADGIWFCDFQAIPSGQGAFGNAGRRALAVDAFYEIMQATAAISCTGDVPGAASANGAVQVNMADAIPSATRL